MTYQKGENPRTLLLDPSTGKVVHEFKMPTPVPDVDYVLWAGRTFEFSRYDKADDCVQVFIAMGERPRVIPTGSVVLDASGGPNGTVNAEARDIRILVDGFLAMSGGDSRSIEEQSEAITRLRDLIAASPSVCSGSDFALLDNAVVMASTSHAMFARWVPVGERLPYMMDADLCGDGYRLSVEVLASDGKSVWVARCHTYGNGASWRGATPAYGDDDITPTHWMPLPEGAS